MNNLDIYIDYLELVAKENFRRELDKINLKYTTLNIWDRYGMMFFNNSDSLNIRFEPFSYDKWMDYISKAGIQIFNPTAIIKPLNQA